MELRREELCSRLIAFVRESFVGEEVVVHSADRLFEEGIVDSLGILQFVEFIEETYAITVRDTDIDLDNFGSIDALADYILRTSADGAE